MPGVRQTSFAAGELSPRMWGRTDLGLYRHGTRRLRDFFVSRQGEAVTRPGTILVGTTYNNELARLIPFVVSESEGYLLEFTTRLRIWKNGAVIATLFYPWSFTPNSELQYTQSGDVMTFCAKYDSYELRRVSPTSFSFGATNFTRKPIQWQLPSNNTKTSVVRLSTESMKAATDTSPERPWRWWVSAVMQDGAGRRFESESYEVTTAINLSNTEVPYIGKVALGVDRPVKLLRSTSFGVWAGTANYKVLSYNYYRGVGEHSGFVGNTTNELEFVDAGEEPNYTLPHPRTSDPFVIPAPSNPPPTGWQLADYPLTVGYFEDRLVYGGTWLRPNSVLLSASGDYIDFVRPAVVTAAQSLEFELASRKRETIRSIVGLQRLLALTDAGVYSMGGQGALTPTSVEVRLVSEKGAAPVTPVILEGGQVLYVRARGRGLQILRESENASGLYGSGDVSWPAEHFFRSDGVLFENPPAWLTLSTQPQSLFRVTEMAFQEAPWGLVWAVRADGLLLSMQWDGQTPGFSLHTTGKDWNDRFESICVVPEEDEDVVYVCANRNNKYTIEKFASRQRKGTWEDDCCVDCATVFREEAVGSNGLLNFGATAGSILGGREVWIVATNNPPIGPMMMSTFGEVNLAPLGAALLVPNENGNVSGYVGLRFQPELESLDIVTADLRMKQRSVVKVGVEVSESRGLFVGQTENNLVQWIQRDSGAGYGVPSNQSALIDIPVKGGWDLAGRCFIRQTLPLPLTILGITREVDVGG